jgi:hypothetical protein
MVRQTDEYRDRQQGDLISLITLNIYGGYTDRWTDRQQGDYHKPHNTKNYGGYTDRWTDRQTNTETDGKVIS